MTSSDFHYGVHGEGRRAGARSTREVPTPQRDGHGPAHRARAPRARGGATRLRRHRRAGRGHDRERRDHRPRLSDDGAEPHEERQVRLRLVQELRAVHARRDAEELRRGGRSASCSRRACASSCARASSWSPAEVKADFVRKGSQVNLEYVRFAGRAYEDDVEPTPAEVAEYATKHEAELKKAFDERKFVYEKMPKELRLRQILVKLAPDAPADVEKATLKKARGRRGALCARASRSTSSRARRPRSRPRRPAARHRLARPRRDQPAGRSRKAAVRREEGRCRGPAQGRHRLLHHEGRRHA